MSFTVYRSSAGSGKTYTLVKEYLGIVLKEPLSCRNILAITFTNKAANEMRERILSSLRDIADSVAHQDSASVKYMLPDLIVLTGLDRDTITSNASVVLGHILHNYQDFSVCTIDSFIHRIIRTFAFDLHLPLNFEVEMDKHAMVGMAVDLLLGRVGLDEVPTTILKKFTESRIDDEKNWDVEKDLKVFSSHLLKDDITAFLPLLESMKTQDILAASQALIKYLKWFEKEAGLKAMSLKNIWETNGIDPADLSRGKNGIYGIVTRLANGDFSNLKVNNYVQATLDEDKWASAKADANKSALIDNLKGMMMHKARELIGHISEGGTRYVFYRLLKKNIFPLAVLHEISAVMQQIRDSEGIIHISEFDQRIAGVVNNEPVPFIYERLGERYRHFLIDEFQDTSVLEWQNILPLVENSLAENHFNMIVGDAKQAIYRFKGGEVEQLVKLPDIHKKAPTPEMNAREKQLHDHYLDKRLGRNFRSREEIIRFNNAFYTFIAGQLPDLLKGIYEDCIQKTSGDKQGGEVRMHFVDADGNNEVKEPFYFEQIRAYIHEMTVDHGFDFRDIAILTRSNAAASKIARNLLLNGINVISAESLLLSSSPEVSFLVFCLDYIANRDDAVAIAGMLSYLAAREGREIHTLMAGILRNEDKNHAYQHYFKHFLKEEGMHLDTDKMNLMGLYERLETLIRIFSLNKSLDPYIMFFMDAVFDYSQNRRLLSDDFTTYWRENNRKFSIVVPEGMDAVNVMTIHKAKGLEFPVVIYPFANSRVDISRDTKWVVVNDPELPGLKAALLPLTADLAETVYAEVYEEETEKALLDMLNILYVATTRPTDRLFLVCDKTMAKSGITKNIPSLIRSFIEQKGLWEEEKDTYSFGDKGERQAEPKPAKEILVSRRFISNDWRENIMLSVKAAEQWGPDDEAGKLKWGNLLHHILSSIDTRADLDAAIRAEVLQGKLKEKESAAVKTLLQDILSKEEVNLFFNGSFRIRNEASIMTAGGMEYRPDRVMTMNGKAIVLDYKTGKENPVHLKQIEMYGKLLEEMGYTDVEKYLLYIDDPCTLISV